MNSEVMRRALEYARGLGLPVIQHAEDVNLSANGPAHEGAATTRIGLRGQPAAAESAIVARDLELVALTGARYHVAHASCAETVRLVREAKRRGLPVTAEVTPHHLTLTDEACAGYDTATRVQSALAQRRRRRGRARGAGRRDHRRGGDRSRAPLAGGEGRGVRAGGVGHDRSRNGARALPRAGRRERCCRRPRWSRACRSRRAKILGLPGGTLAPGSPADVTVLDPTAAWTCDPARLRSRSRNTPFGGRVLRGRAMLTVVAGNIVFAEEKLVG